MEMDVLVNGRSPERERGCLALSRIHRHKTPEERKSERPQQQHAS